MEVSTRQIGLFRPVVSEEAIQAAAEVLRSGWLGMGPKTAQFEQEFGWFVGADTCVMVNTCTSALHLAVKCARLQPGTEVITTPITFVSSNHVLLYEGLEPVFADVQPRTGNLDPESVRRRITERTGAILLVHYAGYPCDLDEIYVIAREHGLAVIEDCAHACGARYRGRRIGSSEGFQAFSFDPIKNLTTGDGGALTTNSPGHDERLRSLRYMGVSKDAKQRLDELGHGSYAWEYQVNEVGYRYHMNDIAAAMGLAQLPYLDRDNERRSRIARHYDSLLAGTPGIELPERRDDRISSHHLYPILAEDRNALADKLIAAGVVVGVYYVRNDTYPMYGLQDLPGVDYFSRHSLCLPMHLDLTEDDVNYICDVIKRVW